MEEIGRVAQLGFLMLVVTLLFTPYEATVEAITAFAFVVAVIAGFVFHPRKDVFYVHTNLRARDGRGNYTKERDVVAIRVELVRLWLLFIPTMIAVGLLVFYGAQGILGRYSALNELLTGTRSVPLAYALTFVSFGVLLLLRVWIRERWVLRDAEAGSAEILRTDKRRVSYRFKGGDGEYYPRYGFDFGLVRSSELRSIVFYNPRKWERNRIAMGLLFHRIVVLGRGVTDLDADTVKQHGALAEPATSEAG
jgi:hypothetical protein